MQIPSAGLIDTDPDVILEPELKDYEFGHYAFETLPKAKSTPVGETLALVDGVDICEINISYDNAENSQFSVKLPLSNVTVFLFTGERPENLGVCARKSRMECIVNIILYKMIFCTGLSWTMVINSAQQ